MPARPLSETVGIGNAELVGLINRLSDQGITVACAESLTGGLLTALLTEVPGASAVVRGGLVVYATDLKASLAGVDRHLLADRGPVDPAVAMALARGARSVCGAAVGLGLTGVAGPDPQDGHPIGTVHVAIAGADIGEVRSRHPAELEPLPAGWSRRQHIRVSAVHLALTMLTTLALAD